MDKDSLIASFAAIIDFCWDILSKPIIANTYSLWNVFQGVFAVWAFKIIIVDGILKYRGWSGKGQIQRDRRGRTNTVTVHQPDKD